MPDIFEKARRRQELVGELLGVVDGLDPEEGAELLAEAALRLSQLSASNGAQKAKAHAAPMPEPAPAPVSAPKQASKSTLPAKGEYGEKIMDMFRRLPTASNADLAQAIYGSTDPAMVKNVRTLLWNMRREGLLSQRGPDGKVEVLK